ncbi:unnamed protein product [Merluccius merluccius]
MATTQGSEVQLSQQLRCCWEKRPTASPRPLGVPGGGYPDPDPSVPEMLAAQEPSSGDRAAQEIARFLGSHQEELASEGDWPAAVLGQTAPKGSGGPFGLAPKVGLGQSYLAASQGKS